ncbi:MAG: DUF1553 domain-containing protein, partial [Armatimonadetes bacterium]|nr:DUF1553 domain-containing protein [Armatimonadota bacterium]
KRREAEEKKRVLLPSIRAFYDQDAAPPPTPFLTRGDWLRPADPVEPGIPAILEDPSRPFRLGSPGSGAYTTGRRTALAAWITRPDHPLTARVLVNRVWFHHFGAGLVSTLDNFGRSGARPSHPALLDWLARTFVETGWSLKRLHRLLVTSSAYRQGTAWQSQSVRVDPDNVWLWRQRPRRLEAEAVRDSVLAVAGTLNPEMFGEPVGLETRGSGEVVAAEEGGRSRRSLYLLVRRTQPVAFLNAFDHPVLETNCTRRTVSATPVQALAQMNSGFLTAQSRNWAQRLLREQPGEPVAPRTRVERAFELAFCRKPAAVEVERSAAFLHDQTARYRALGRGQSALEEAWGDFCQALLSANEFLYVD